MGAETILPDNAVVFVSHAHRGAPIYVNMGPGDHSVTRKQISPLHALEMAQMLIEYASRELGHPLREPESRTPNSFCGKIGEDSHGR